MIHGFLFAAVATLFRRACKVVGWFAAVPSAFHGLARFDVRARAQSSRPPTDFSAPLEIFELRELREETTSLSSLSQAFPFFCFDSTADSSDSSARGISHRPRLPCEAETRPGTMDNCDPEAAPFELLDTDV
jgi:hypothetical protein